MNLENLTTEELFVVTGGDNPILVTGGDNPILVTGGNGDYYDDGSGQGCIPDLYIKFPKY
jgi:hypothetical protein